MQHIHTTSLPLCGAALAGLSRAIHSDLDGVIQSRLLRRVREDCQLDVERLACGERMDRAGGEEDVKASVVER